jgi:YVTN family beta-propeller protein
MAPRALAMLKSLTRPGLDVLGVLFAVWCMRLVARRPLPIAMGGCMRFLVAIALATLAIGLGFTNVDAQPFAYVPNQDSNNVSVIDTSTNTEVLPRIPVGSQPVGVALTPNGAFAYVTNFGSHDVSVINTSTNTEVLPRIPVGFFPFGVAFTLDGAFAYVVNFSTVSNGNTTPSNVSVIDTSTNTEVLPRIPVGTSPRGVAITPVTNAPMGQEITVTTHAPASATFSTSFSVAATGGASGNPVVIAASGVCSGGGNGTATILMTAAPARAR